MIYTCLETFRYPEYCDSGVDSELASSDYILGDSYGWCNPAMSLFAKVKISGEIHGQHAQYWSQTDFHN